MDGDSLDLAEPSCDRVLDRDVARAAIDAGRCVVEVPSLVGGCRGAAGTARWDVDSGRFTRDVVDAPFWGKTGTTDGEKSASLTLSTRKLAVSGILTDPDWADTDQPMKHDIVNPTVIHTLSDAMKGVETEDWPAPSDKLAFGDQVRIPDVECLPVSEAESVLSDAGFRVRVDDNPVESSCEEGLAAGTNPSGRTVRGGTVEIQISDGSQAEEEEEPGPGPRPRPTIDPTDGPSPPEA